MAKLALQSRLLWLFVLIGHAVGAIGWLWFMPHGFPVAHPRFWANGVVPIVILFVAILAIWAARRERLAVVRIVLLALAAMWATAAVSGRVIFPISTPLRWLAPLGLSAAITVAAFGPRLRRVRWPVHSTALAVTLAAGVGAALPWLQRGPDPSTLPLNDGMAAAPSTLAPLDVQVRTRHVGGALVQLNDGQVTFSRDRYFVYVQPLLSFTSRSPDGCWTSLAPRELRVGPRRRLIQVDDDGLLHYTDDDHSTLAVSGDESHVDIVAHSRLPQPVFSHLNSFCELQLAGHRKLSVSFSPCPDVKVDVLDAGYPIGKPARCAYLGADGVFRVVEARSGEKGPFRELARGSLSRSDVITMTFHDDGRPFCTVTLDDFAAQASIDLSPTAGWKLPMNAIEFSLSDARPTSPASVFVTLAGTSVGRGWDSVGHAAGTYRNRMSIAFVGEQRAATSRAITPD
jgi:hypothetical protein